MEKKESLKEPRVNLPAPPIESSPASRTKTKTKQIQVVALYDYLANESEELSMREGQVFVLVDGSDEDWWKVSLDGNSGLVPKSYVEIVPVSFHFMVRIKLLLVRCVMNLFLFQ